MSEFKKFLAEEEVADVVTIQSTLSRRFGSALKALGWAPGHKGTGIVAMVDDDEGTYEDGVTVVNDFLKSQGLKVLKKGRVSGEMMTEYRGVNLSVVKATGTFKILVTV